MTHTVLLVVLTNARVFFARFKTVEKAELSKCSWYPKRKLGVTTHFSEIIKLQLGKEPHTLLCTLKILQILLVNSLQKMRGYPQFSFWISITLVKICFSRIVSKPRKNTFELVGTVLKVSIWAREISSFGYFYPGTLPVLIGLAC